MITGNITDFNRKMYILFRYGKNTVFFLFTLPLSIILLLVVRSIYPLIIVRMGWLISWRIGHYAGNVDMYLCEKKANINTVHGRSLDVWCDRTKACNSQLRKMWGREINILPNAILYPVILLNDLIPGGGRHKIPKTKSDDKDILNLVSSVCQDPNLYFTCIEKKRGQMLLKELGVSGKFVCLTVRDSAYLEKQKKDCKSNVDWSYHNYRDSDIDTYELAINRLIELGYYIIRMGVIVEKPIRLKSEYIIDYAYDGIRTDFMDVYLAYACDFCITTATGYDALPSLFRKPLCVVNYGHIEYFQTFPDSITIFKKVRVLESGEYLSLRKIINKGIGRIVRTDDFYSAGVELVDNTSEEIRDAVVEMALRFSGKWNDCWYDDVARSIVEEIYKDSELNGEIQSRLGTSFLRDNMWILDDCAQSENKDKY